MRKTHNSGRKHKDCVRAFFVQWVLDQGAAGYLPAVRGQMAGPAAGKGVAGRAWGGRALVAGEGGVSGVTQRWRPDQSRVARA